MKKLLLGLGSIASVVAPVAAVISCGDDNKNTNTGNNGTAPAALDEAKQTALKTAANTALGMTSNDIDSVAKAATISVTKAGQSKTLENAVVYNMKSSVTSITVSNGTGSTTTITSDGGGQIIIGSSSTALRTGEAKHYYIATKTKTGGGDMNTLDEITDANTLSLVKTSILNEVYPPATDGTTTGGTTAVDLKADLDKFTGAVLTSTKNAAELKTALSTVGTVTVTALGITEPTLTVASSATYSIAAAYNGTDATATVTVTLVKTGAASVTNETKVIQITPHA